jgi:hypothetical protein
MVIECPPSENSDTYQRMRCAEPVLISQSCCDSLSDTQVTERHLVRGDASLNIRDCGGSIRLGFATAVRFPAIRCIRKRLQRIHFQEPLLASAVISNDPKDPLSRVSFVYLEREKKLTSSLTMLFIIH